MIRTDYRFTLTRDTDTFEVFPEGFFAGSFKYEQEDGQLFFRRKYDGKLSFRGYDYNYIKDRYDLGNYCDIYELLIEKYDKNTSAYIVDWMGYFSMTDGDFDFERCRYSVNPTIQDKYTCILNNWETEFNILTQSKKAISSKVNSIIEFILITEETGWKSVGDVLNQGKNLTEFQCIYIYDDPDNNLFYYLFAREAIIFSKYATLVGANWKDVNSETNQGSPYPDPANNAYDLNYEIKNYLDPVDQMNKYARRIFDSKSAPAAGDILINNDSLGIALGISITRPDPNIYNYYGFSQDDRYYWGLVSLKDIYVKKAYYNFLLFTQSVNYINCVSLNDTIGFLANSNCSDLSTSIISEFLSNATNPVTGVASKTNHLYIIQKSDAKRPGASQQATKGIITFKDLMTGLYNMAQLWWFIDDDNKINIVHQSEISTSVGIDITQSPYNLTSVHKKMIEFDKGLLYRYEKWTFMEAKNVDFVGDQIEYDEQCTIKETVSKTKKYDTNNITFDLAHVQTDQDNVSDDGFVIVATDNTEVINEVGLISGELQLNGHLCLANLHYNYWRHSRILATGLMNGVQTNFLSVQKIRKLAEQQIKYCGEFDPLDKVTTELGDALVNEAEFFPLDSKLVLNMSI